MKRRATMCAMAATLLFASADGASAQNAGPTRQPVPAKSDTVPPAYHPSIPALALGGSLGSLAGLIGGALLGVRVGWGGGDDPGLVSAVIFGFGGSTLGTAAGMELFSGGRVPTGHAIGGGLVGLAGGLAAIYILQEATHGTADDFMFFAYSIGQGTIAALFAAVSGR